METSHDGSVLVYSSTALDRPADVFFESRYASDPCVPAASPRRSSPRVFTVTGQLVDPNEPTSVTGCQPSSHGQYTLATARYFDPTKG